MKNWSLSCCKHFKPPTIIEEKEEIKYQFICQTYVTLFCPKTQIQKPTEILLLFSPRNTRRIPQPIFSAMSNLARVKSSMNHKVLPIMHMCPHTARLYCDTLSHFGCSSAISHLQSLETSPSSGSSRCCMQRLKHHLRKQSHKTPRRSTASQRSMLAKFLSF